MATTEYEGLDLAEISNEFERVSAEPGSFGNNDFMEKLVRLPERDGYVLMRFLPRKKGGKFFCATRVHTLNNPTTGKKKSYHCPKVLVQTDRGPRWQGECIICKFYQDMWTRSESLNGKAREDMQNDARKIKPVERYYYNVIVRSEKDFKTGETRTNVGPKIYSCGKTVHQKILGAINGDAKNGIRPLGDITHPTTGRDFRLIKKVVKGTNGQEYPNYNNSNFDPESSAGNKDDLEKWLNNLNDLQALRMVKSDEELRQALRIHQGLVITQEEDDSDLDEFRNAPVSHIQNTVRESVSVSTLSNKVDEEILADSDFLKELDGM